jgi:hypothetical protein
MKGLKMKKLMLMISAIAAGFTSAANADISISGSAGLGLVNNAVSNVNDVYTGGALSFALSSTLDNGVTVSTSAGIRMDTNDTKTTSATYQRSTGFSSITFAGANSSLTWGQDVDLAGEGAGGAGGVASDLVDEGGYDRDTSAGLTKDSGGGLLFTTAVGTASVSASYIAQCDTSDTSNVVRLGDSTDTTCTGVSVSVPFGDAAVTVGYATVENDDTVSGMTLAYPVADGSVKVGYRSVTDATNETSWGASYTTTMGTATVAVGYNHAKAGTASGSQTEAQIAQSLGGGASVYAEIQNNTDTDSDSDGTNFAIGTKYSF